MHFERGSLTSVEFADAIRKGLGRAALAVNGPVSPEFEEIILSACQEDQRFDRQFEDERTGYLMTLVERAGLTERLRGIVVKLINESVDERLRRHRMRFIGHFARQSDARAWEILTGYASDMDFDAFSVIEDQGTSGIEWLVENVLDRLPLDEKWRAGGWFEEYPELSTKAADAIKAAKAEFDQNLANRRGKEIARKQESFEEALENIRTQNLHNSILRRIGPDLTDEQVHQVANLWLKERDNRRGRNYSLLFQVREFPLPIESVIELVQSGDLPIKFEEILSKINSPLVRELGLNLIESDPPDLRGYLCLCSSYIEDDLPMLLVNLDGVLDGDQDDLHGLVIDLKKLAEGMPINKREPFLVWVYEHSPCSMCRGFAVEIMVNDQTLPKIYSQELPFDADSYARQLVGSGQ